MQDVHVDRRENSRPGATYGQCVVSWKWPAVLVGHPKYRPFGIESRSQADALEELHITLYLENCGFAELQSPGLCGFILFFSSQKLLESKSPHLPRSNSYGLGFRVYGLPRPTQTAAQQRCRSLLSFGAFCNCRHQGMRTQPLIV